MNRLTPLRYKAATTLLVNTVVSDGSTAADWRFNARGRLVFDNTSQGQMANLRIIDQSLPTYAQMLVLPASITAALGELGLNYTADSVPAEITVQSVRGTQLLELHITSTDAQLAVNLARALPAVFNRHYVARQAAQYQTIQASLTQEIVQVQAQSAQNQTQIAALGKPRDPAQAAELDRLRSIQTQLDKNLTDLTRVSTLQQISLAQAEQALVVVEPAVTPLATHASVWRDLVAGGLIGLSAALGLTSLILLLDDRVRSVAQLERAVQLPILGTIGQWSTTAPALIAWREPRAPEVEALRTLRTNLQFASIDRPLRTVLITSDSPNQGKSTIAANLAVVMAQAGLKVALIDADLRRPTLHQKFEQANRLGLTEALLCAPTDWPTLPLVSGVPNLSLVVSGALPPNPAELLGSRRMQQWLDHLRQTQDIIIIDAPPILVVTDAEVLSRTVDGVILVTAYGSTRLQATVVSKQLLDRLGARCVGVVLNRLPSHAQSYYGKYQSHFSDQPRPG